MLIRLLTPFFLPNKKKPISILDLTEIKTNKNPTNKQNLNCL